MKAKRKTGEIAMLLMLFLCSINRASVEIEDVHILPVVPYSFESITIFVSGEASSDPSWVETSSFTVDGTNLLLDLHVDMGAYAATSEWSHEELIGTLAPSIYNLTVQAFGPDRYPWNGELEDTHTIEFTVIPEPGILAIFTLGILSIFRKQRSR